MSKWRESVCSVQVTMCVFTVMAEFVTRRKQETYEDFCTPVTLDMISKNLSFAINSCSPRCIERIYKKAINAVITASTRPFCQQR